MFDLSIVDWENANAQSNITYVKLVADYWNAGMGTTEISKIVKLSASTVCSYLKVAASINMCDYNVEKSKRRGARNAAITMKKLNSKPVAVYTNNILIGMFKSATELSQQSNEVYGKHFTKPAISAVCRGKWKQAYGYTMKYIPLEEYEKFLPQFKTIQN